MQEVIAHLEKLTIELKALRQQVSASQCGLSNEKDSLYLCIEKHPTGELWSTYSEAGVLTPNPAKSVQGFILSIAVDMEKGRNGKFRLHLGDRQGKEWVIDCGAQTAFATSLCKLLLKLESTDSMVKVAPDGGKDFKNPDAKEKVVFAKLAVQTASGFVALYSPKEDDIRYSNPVQDAIAHINGLLGGQTPAARPVAPVPPPIPAPAAAPAVQLAEGSPFEVVEDAWDRLWYVAQSVGLNDEAKAKKRIEEIASEIGTPFNDGKLTSTQVGLIRDSILIRWASAKTKTKPDVWKGHQVMAVFCDAMTKIKPPLIVSQARDEEVVKVWVELVGDRLQ